RRPGRGRLGRPGDRVAAPTGVDLARERLGLVHADVGIGYEGGEIVGVVADHLAGKGPVERNAYLVDDPPGHLHRPEPPRDHGPRLDTGPRRLYREPAPMHDAPLRGQLGAQLDEHLGLELVEPAVEPA